MAESISAYAQKYARRRSLSHGAEDPLPILFLTDRSTVPFARGWSWVDFKPLERRKV